FRNAADPSVPVCGFRFCALRIAQPIKFVKQPKVHCHNPTGSCQQCRTLWARRQRNFREFEKNS
ncbi:MAG: hypothetical protein LUG87_04280, partial [Oscillospiraceae bacterium]|nr:hypothetical protein [Oscillospiraceae bacterium]